MIELLVDVAAQLAAASDEEHRTNGSNHDANQRTVLEGSLQNLAVLELLAGCVFFMDALRGEMAQQQIADDGQHAKNSSH